MNKFNIDIAREGAAPEITHCVVIGEGANVRLAFLTGGDGEEPVSLLSAVTLTRAQLAGFAGMVAAIEESDDPNAFSMN